MLKRKSIVFLTSQHINTIHTDITVNLKSKFSLFVSFIIILILSCVSILLITVRSSEIENELIIRDKLITQIIIPDISSDLGNYYTYEYTTFTSVIKNIFNQNKDLLHLQILNPDGLVVFDSTEIAHGKYTGTDTRKIQDQQIVNVLLSKRIFQDFSQYNGQRTIRIVTPYIDNYGIFRYVLISNFSLQSITTTIASTIQFLLLLCGFFVFVGIGLTFILVNHFAKQIKSLIEGAKEIGNGNLNYTIKVVNPTDEIGQLAVVFNSMATKLNESYTNLENKIAEKTAVVSEQLSETEKLNKLMIDRELKMIALKEELNKLSSQKDATNTQDTTPIGVMPNTPEVTPTVIAQEVKEVTS